jgi:colanic acid biosynthesis glycosyl transferase WcaI
MPSKRSILFLNRYYWPDVAATGQMLTDLAEDLARDGWNVTVIAGRSAYSGNGARLPRQESRNGVRILRVASGGYDRDRAFGRLADYVTYMGGAFLRLLRIRQPEVVVAMSDPPFLLLPVLAAARLRGSRTVYWLQDLYPHVAARLGVLRENGVIFRLLARLARGLHARCDLVIALGPQMWRAAVAAGSPPERTVYIHNWADSGSIQPVAREENPFLAEHGLADKFVVLYSGNAGRAHTFESIIEAMRRLRDEPDIVFVFIGGGQQFPRLRRAAEAEGLRNVRFFDYLPRRELPYSLSAASVSLVSEHPDVRGLLLPSKTYGILASGRPVVFVGDEQSDVARIVREARCGLVVAPDDADALVELIRSLRDDPAHVAAMGRNARHAAEAMFSRDISTSSWGRTVAALVDPDAAAAAAPAVPSAA